MESLCHRCGNAMQEGEVFCPHCGAPQLVVETGDPGAPAQPAMRSPSDAHRVEWRTAITSALVVAIPVGLLSALTGMYSLFVLVGGFAAIALYRRRSTGLTDGRIGWRVGSILGMASAAIAAATYATRLVVLRYLLHDGKAIDQIFQQAAQMDADYWMKASAQQGPQPEEVMHAIKTLTAFFQSPDGHVAMQLLTTVVMSLGMVLFAAVGGSFAGWLQSTRARTQRSL
ncbi:MAG TPA: zinc ribbon domain-containing protein [Acidobacteriaceae bacterium]|nr:zinc ribbon domain-containing protein [Acidobacteriaceae bacterium]